MAPPPIDLEQIGFESFSGLCSPPGSIDLAPGNQVPEAGGFLPAV
ncbi:MAG: hypothetical protein ACR2Q3_20085 [Woeseiaceae bacterium]